MLNRLESNHLSVCSCADRVQMQQLAAEGQWQGNYGVTWAQSVGRRPPSWKGCFPWLAQLRVKPPLQTADWSSSQGSQLPVCCNELLAVRRCWQEQLDIREWWKEREIHGESRQNGPLGKRERIGHLPVESRTAPIVDWPQGVCTCHILFMCGLHCG